MCFCCAFWLFCSRLISSCFAISSSPFSIRIKKKRDKESLAQRKKRKRKRKLKKKFENAESKKKDEEEGTVRSELRLWQWEEQQTYIRRERKGNQNLFGLPSLYPCWFLSVLPCPLLVSKRKRAKTKPVNIVLEAETSNVSSKCLNILATASHPRGRRVQNETGMVHKLIQREICAATFLSPSLASSLLLLVIGLIVIR